MFTIPSLWSWDNKVVDRQIKFSRDLRCPSPTPVTLSTTTFRMDIQISVGSWPFSLLWFLWADHVLRCHGNSWHQQWRRFRKNAKQGGRRWRGDSDLGSRPCFYSRWHRGRRSSISSSSPPSKSSSRHHRFHSWMIIIIWCRRRVDRRVVPPIPPTSL